MTVGTVPTVIFLQLVSHAASGCKPIAVAHKQISITCKHTLLVDMFHVLVNTFVSIKQSIVDFNLYLKFKPTLFMKQKSFTCQIHHKNLFPLKSVKGTST